MGEWYILTIGEFNIVQMNELEVYVSIMDPTWKHIYTIVSLIQRLSVFKADIV